MSSFESLRTVDELLAYWAAQRPDAPLFRLLGDDGQEEGLLTFSALQRKASAIARRLQEYGATGERAVLLYAPGLDFMAAFFGCLLARVVAVPAYPPDPTRLGRTLPRLRAIFNDAQAKFALTTSMIYEMADFLFAEAPDLRLRRWVTTDDVPESAASELQALPPFDVPAFLQYTSGSTASPKGVMVTHKNLLHNLALINERFITDGKCGVFWLPTYHDMGLIGGVMGTLYSGAMSTFMSPLTFLKKPLLWLHVISQLRASHSGAPNFAYDLCVRRATERDLEELDLSSWQLAFCGAEPVRADTLERFVATFGRCGFRRQKFHPCYGLAEATLMVSAGKFDGPPMVRRFNRAALERGEIVVGAADGGDKMIEAVGCGQPVQRVAIVDPETRCAAAPNRVGEIWVKGDSVAEGYFERRAESDLTFRARTIDGDGPFLRTGDLGFLHEGELFVAGRKKDVIIIRGRNLYPQDIERAVESSHPAFRPGCGAAFASNFDGTEQLVVVQEVERRHSGDPRRNGDGESAAERRRADRRKLDSDPGFDAPAPTGFDPAAAIAVVRRTVAEEFGVQARVVALVKSGTIPKTSSGKIQRRACREAFERHAIEVVAEHQLPEPAAFPSGNGGAALAMGPQRGLDSGAILEWIVARLAEHSGRLPSEVDIDRPFADCGLDSLQAIEFVSELEAWVGREIPNDALLASPDIRSLVLNVVGQTVARKRPAPIARVEDAEEVRALLERIALAEQTGANSYMLPNARDVGATCEIEGREYLLLGSYNYLGLANHPAVKEAAIEAVRRFGCSSAGVRLLTGTTELHLRLEAELARIKRAEAAICYTSGHLTNTTVISTICRADDLVLADTLSHDSIQQGLLLSRATVKFFKHNDPAHLRQLLERSRHLYRQTLIVCDAVYSLDGDVAPVPEFVRLKREFGCQLMVDEAHSLGVLGKRGTGCDEYFNLSPDDIDIKMGTLSKAIPSTGGYVAGSKGLIRYLQFASSGFVFSASLTPAATASALQGLEILLREPERVTKLQENAHYFLERARELGLDTIRSRDTPIIPVLIGDDARTFAVAAALRSEGIVVPPVIHPAVPKGQGRLRFCVTSLHSHDELNRALTTLSDLLGRI